MAYCRWLSEVTGKTYSLPSEAEWEKGARGTDGRIYPWGNQWDATRCNTREGGRGGTAPVGTYPRGASPYGLLDMAGNVWEWTRSLWGGYPYPIDAEERAQRENLQAPNDQDRVLRGGAFNLLHRLVRCAVRYGYYPDFRLRYLGFRVVLPAS
jgi:toxoflavin biosynthesis protein ToxD